VTSSDSPQRAYRLFSMFFLLVFASIAVIQPYLTLYYNQIGFSGVQIGMVAVISALAVILLAPYFGHIYDQSRHKRLFLIIAELIVVLSLGAVPFLREFALVTFLFSVHRIASTVSISTMENLAFQVGSLDGRSRFGKLRMWGSFGFGLMAFMGGQLMHRYQIQANNTIFIVLVVLVLAVILLIPESVFARPVEEDSTRLSIWAVLKLILKDKYLLLLVIALALTDPVLDGIRSFEPIYMKDLGFTEVIIGLSVMLSAISEIPMMINADRLVSKIGVQRVLLFVFAFDLARRLVVWIFPSAGMVFVTTVLNSVSFPLRLVSTVTLINLHIPRQYTTTANTFVGLTLIGVGYMVSNAAAGWLYDQFGGRPVYLMGACLCLIALSLTWWAKDWKKDSE
jgi:PPP family 3-phenylpropionic acid transporter